MINRWVVLFLLLGCMGIHAYSESLDPALGNLEVQILGSKHETDHPEVRIRRLEKFLSTIPASSVSIDSQAFRMAQLYALQQKASSGFDRRAALQAYNTAVDEASKKNIEKAIELYQKAISLDQSLVPAYNNLAALLDQQHQYEEAIGLYQQALALKPDDPYLHRNLGVVYEKTGQVEKALAEYKAYLGATDKPDPPIQSILETYEASRKLGSTATDYLALTDQVTGGERLLWPEHLNPLKVYVQVNDPKDTLFLKDAQAAMAEWSTALKGRLELRQTGNPEEAQIQIGFKTGPLSHPFLDVGHANFNVEDKRNRDKMKINITVNTGEVDDNLSIGLRRQQVGRLVLHELGHAIGIWGHSPDPKDIMFTHPIAEKLSTKDIRTVRKLYGLTE